MGGLLIAVKSYPRVGNHNLDVEQYFVEQGADKDQQDRNGYTLLLLAASYGQLKMVQYFVEQGADKDQQHRNGQTPLMLTASKGNLEVVRYLVEQGVDKDKEGKYGKTPLKLALDYGQLDVAQYLVEQGAAKRNKGNNDGAPSVSAAAEDHSDANKDRQPVVMWAAKPERLDTAQMNANPADNPVLRLLLSHSHILENGVFPGAKLLMFEHGTPLMSNNEENSAKSVTKTEDFHHIIALMKEHATKCT